MTGRRAHGTLVVRDGRIAEATDGLAALSGRPISELVGSAPLDLLVPEDRPRVVALAARSAHGEVPQAIELSLLLPDGGRRLVEWHLDRDGGAELVHVRDLGEVSAALDAARTIADLSRRNAHLAVLARVAELAGEASDLPTFLRRASEVVRPVAGYVGCAAFVADEGSGDLVLVHLDHTAPRGLEERIRRIALSTPLGEVVRTRTARVAPIPYDSATPGLVQALGAFRAMAWVPLVARSRGVGALVAAYAGGVDEAQASIELLTALGAHFASAIESHGFLADLRRRVDEQTLLLDVARASAQLDPALVLEGAMRRVCATIGADMGAAWIREDDRLVLHSSVGLEGVDPAAIAQLPVRGSVPGLAVERRAPVRLAAGEALGPHLPGARGAELGAAIAVPLVAKGDAVGALLLARAAAAAPFGDGDAALLSSLGAQLGVALDSARLFVDVRRRLADLEAVHALTLRVFANAPGDLGALVQDACSELQRALSVRSAVVYLVGDGGHALRAAAFAGPPLPPEAQAIDLRQESLASQAMRTRTPVHTEDATRDPRSRLFGHADAPPMAMLAIPLVSRRDVRGLVLVADRGGRRFGPGELAVANALAGALGVGVENAELYADARRRVEELSALNEAARAIAGSLDLDEVLRQAAEAARRLVGTPRAYAILHDPVTGTISFGAGVGIDEGPLRGLRGPVPAGTVLERVLRDGRPEVVTDAAASDVGPVYRAHFGGRALAAAPVLLRGEPQGVLVVDDPAAPREFSAPDLERLTAVADRLAVAMENARLYRETRRRAEELGLLHEVGRSLVHTLELEDVLSGGTRSLARIVDAPGAYLALATPDGAALELRALFGDDPRARIGLRVPTDPTGSPTTIANLVFQRREPILVEDAEVDPRISPEMRERTGARAYLGLPLVVHDRCIGTVVIVETRRPRLFTPAEVERAAAVANQLAVAVENARLYEDLRRSYSDLARAQQQLVQGERLAALGEMSAVVAHEVRNPLGVIFNSVGSLRRLLRPMGDAKTLLEIVEEEADRLNRIVGDLLDFARPSTPEVRPELLGRVAEDAVAAAVQPQAARIQLVRELDPALPPVAMDARLVRQAILNVAVNAVQAMPRGGRLTVRTRREGDAAVVELEDSGAGIPDEVRGRIFEPFFTTKASGTGLGLAVVRRIVEGHGGHVRVRSAPGAGTAFSLSFPLAAPVENDPPMR